MSVWTRVIRPRLRHLKHRLRPGNIRLADQDTGRDSPATKLINHYVVEESGYVDAVPEPLNPPLQRHHVFADRAMWYLRDVDFFPAKGFLAHRRRVIGDSKTNGALEDRCGLAEIVVREITEGVWLPLVHQPWNYYHWLLEDLPVIIRAQKAEPSIKLALPAHPPAFVTEALGIIGVDYLTFSRPTKFAQVALPGRGIDPGWPHRGDVSLLEKFGRAVVGDDGAGNIRGVYVSRLFSTRGLDNEEQLEQWARDRGLDVVYAEQLTFVEQVALFAQSSIVVGTHGAGLSSTVFSPPTTPLIEVASPRRADPCFENLARNQQRPYRRVLGTPGKRLDSTVLSPEGFAVLDAALPEVFDG